MSDYSDLVLTLSPICYWLLDDLSPSTTVVDASPTGRNGIYQNGPVLEQPPGIDDGGFSVFFGGGSQQILTPAHSDLDSASQFSVNFFAQLTGSFDSGALFYIYQDTVRSFKLEKFSTDFYSVGFKSDSGQAFLNTADNFTVNDQWYMFTVVYDSGSLKLYLDGVEATGLTPGGAGTLPTQLWSGTSQYYVARERSTNAVEGFFDHVSVHSIALSQAEISNLYAVATGATGPINAPLPMTLSGFLSSGQTTLPMRLTGQTAAPAASIPMRLQSADSADFTGAVLQFGAAVVLGGVDISAQLSGPISITHEEDASGLADFVIIPPPGPIDLNAYERKPVTISFVSGGVALRRFTGVTASANFDPDSGLMTIDCTTDLQGQLEQMERPAIDNLIGGLWSEFVFDATADGWQYAQDQLSTTQSEIHVDLFGNLVVVPWAAKGTPDITLTDSERFSDSLTIERANLRDLLSKVRVNFDFRFTRLRHREIQVNWISQRGFCDWANNNWLLAGKETVRAAADNAQWTRTSEIFFEDLPPANPSICSPPRAWAGGADEFALGGSWQAARRWAQTITEEFAIDVTSPDIEQSIGPQQVNADYSMQNTFDSTDYEAQQDFTGPPADFVFSSKSNDWQKDADDNPTDGRAAMQYAQQVAMQAAKSEILGRARSNRVGVSHIYDPTMTLGYTVRINTPYLQATGKVALIEETINPVTGDLGMAIEIAVSRHGGTGLGAEDPLDPPTPPEQPQEADTGRIYTIGYHVGGEEFSPPDDEEWDGWMTNVLSNGDSYFPGGETYDVRFVVAYPEVETDARDELTADEISTFNVIVPLDELEISS